MSVEAAAFETLLEAPPEPVHAFSDSRRLPGANLFFAGPAVVLTVAAAVGASAVARARAYQDWRRRVHGMAQALGWPDPQALAPDSVCEPAGTDAHQLAFAAPVQALFTATEVNEWAWERSATEAGVLPPQVSLTQPEDTLPVAHFAALAQAEYSRPLAQLRQAAQHHRLPFLEDDDTVSIGAGCGSVSYPRHCVPLVMDVPWPRLHSVPTALVTGSNGKTTTTRLLAAMARADGRVVGLSSTEGVWVGGALQAAGDYAGPAGARAVLRHPAVELAVLETARGGLLRRGLAVPQAQVAVITNISADHLGEYGIHHEADIARAKLVLAHAVRTAGTLVLNADDPTLMHTAAATPHAAQSRWALFSMRDAAHEPPAMSAMSASTASTASTATNATNATNALTALRQQGGSTCALHDGRLRLWHAGQSHDLGRAADLPLSLNGAASYNTANALAAVLAAVCLGLSIDAILQTLLHFGTHPGDNPGRLERWHHHGATVLIDYAHNPDGLAQLLRTARALKPRRLGLLLGQAGNRDDAALQALAEVAARAAPDRVQLKELPAMLRGRASGEVSRLLHQGLLHAGLPAAAIHHEADEFNAAHQLLAWAQAGDVVVLAVHTQQVRERLVSGLMAASAVGGDPQSPALRRSDWRLG